MWAQGSTRTSACGSCRASDDLCFVSELVDGKRRWPVYFPLEHCSTFAGRLPVRAAACATELWHEHLVDHPRAKMFPLVVPIVLTQPLARNTPTRLSAILGVPPHLREIVPSPIEVRVYADDLSGSVLDDPVADRVTLARVELARAFLYAHGNPASLTRERLVGLAPLFDVLLGQREPLASQDVRALLKYVLRTHPEGSPVRALVQGAIRGRSRAMFVSIADSLVAKGRKAGLAEGRKTGLAEGRKTGLARGLVQGEARGRKTGLARAVLWLLEDRFSSIPLPIRERVSTSRDERQLRRWLARAAVGSSIEEVFGEREG